MANPIGRAHAALTGAALLLAVVAFLIDRAARDVDEARGELRKARARALEAEEVAETAKRNLDGALEALHEAKPDEPPAA